MKEEFLHYLWKYSLYDPDSIRDTENNKIKVIHPGEYNHDAGPDFFNARLIIGGTEWAGNVEIHSSASHFDTHGHNLDRAYDNVILHVVAMNDKKVFNSKGVEILTTTMSFNPELYEKYLDLVNNPFIIACQEDIRQIDPLFVRHWLGSLVIERLREKSEQILRIYSETGNDWEETFYRLLCRYFGFRVNTEPFEMLATALPFRIIRKHSDNRFQIEALLFGSAGLLDEGLFREAVTDDYYISLIREYKILSAKYSLQPLHGWIWKFARLRPANFPTVRLSQLAAMLSGTGGLFSRALECNDIKDLKGVFDVRASDYWDNHFVFGRESRYSPKHTGSQASDILLINAVIPSIFVYGRTRDINEVCEKALSFLEEIAPEENSIINEWKVIGIEAESAFFSQALLQLRNSYCRKRRCLDCRIGARLISLGRSFRKQEELMLEP
ncbi:MAG TPA: DUF2851 domain-containing protein [Bacteroidales bacterium]|nr:DUF2851 domain-containing protein [Bacteroidales bacterium]